MTLNAVSGLDILETVRDGSGAIKSLTVNLGKLNGSEKVIRKTLNVSVTLSDLAQEISGFAPDQNWSATFELYLEGAPTVDTTPFDLDNYIKGTGGVAGSDPGASVTATLTPSEGGTVNLGDEAYLEIPAGALQGSDNVEVKIQKVSEPPAAPIGFRFAGEVYQFSVDGADGYQFTGQVTIKMAFDPALVAADEPLMIQYYDEAAKKWVDLGGAVSGNFVTVSVDHFTSFAVMAETKEEASQPTVDLLDIAGHWASENISRLVALGAISGYPDGTFRPDNNMTRAEFATVLTKVFQLAPQSGKVFTDTAKHWAREYISAVVESGIASGYDEHTFGPDDLITREQMAVMTVRAIGLTPAAGETSFADRERISAWAREAVAAAVEQGIMAGYPDHTLRPQANATRAEAVTVIVCISP